MGSVFYLREYLRHFDDFTSNDNDDLSFAFLSHAQRLGGQFSSIDRVS